jgi:cysteine desulfurase / selenocysteine lyase
VSEQAIRLLLDLALAPDADQHRLFGRDTPFAGQDVKAAMDRIAAHARRLTQRALDSLARIDGIEIYGPRDASLRTPLVAFNLPGRSPFEVAAALDARGIEARAGCHCATLAHRELRLDPPASCRLSFYLYNTEAEVDLATSAVAEFARGAIAA